MYKHNLLIAGTFCTLLAATSFVVYAQSSPLRSTRDGVFSGAQVERGRESFTWKCMDCHELQEFTGVGAYLEGMDKEPIWAVFEYIWAEMPEDMPAWLEPEEYADILSYILSVYGMPTGPTDLPVDQAALEAIQLQGPELPGS